MQREVTNKRGGTRHRMLKGGVIAFSGRHATIPCVLRDLSDGGARLQVAQGSSVPDTFELMIELDGLEVPCQVAWRKPHEIGVIFLEPPTRGARKRMQVVGQTGPVARATLRRGAIAAPLATQAVTSAITANDAPAVPAPTAAALVSPAVEASAASGEPCSHASQFKGARAAPPRMGTSDRQIPIVIAEDDPDDRMLMQDAFAESQFSHPIAFVGDGEELLRYVRGEPPFADRLAPGLILLDLNMPRMDGRTALMHLKTDPTFKRIPVIVLTTSNAEDDIQRTYELGVTAYISKPGTHRGLLDLVSALNNFWTRFVCLPAA